MEFGEQPQDAVIREAKEELGIVVEPSSIRFLALGINQITGEPDLLALVEASQSARQIDKAFRQKAERWEFHRYEKWKLSRANLASIVADFHSAIWSQPSDRATVLLMLIKELGKEEVERAFARLIKDPCSDDQNRYFTFTLDPT